ncbi:hypothetical protein BT96DRAFT_941918 [Gymnopus androsaceus JB14]|uniref:Uncharacterized protein n=1 Tax=Gymnopus androsaceus JB14 TaxID=1447944 RepID=A0A6A4HFU5_9AGAR|nr:hypothetical protein BT96DRAFT_941918 [Gymnopus androsaceus JB14]
MPVITRAAFKAHQLKFPSFTLEDALDNNGKVRKDACEGVEIVDDEDVKLEDEENTDNLQPSRPSSVSLDNSLGPPPSSASSPPSSIPSLDEEQAVADPLLGLSGEERRKVKKKANKRICERKQRAETARTHEAENELRPRAVENTKNACPNRLSDFESSTLPISSSGRPWEASGTPHGLRLSFAGVGYTCIVLVDAQDRIMTVLAGTPPSAEEGGDWANSRAAGISYGGGRKMPGNV